MKQEKYKIVKQIEKLQNKLKELEEAEQNNDWLDIPELGISVSKLHKPMTYIEAEEYCKKNNCKMLNVLQAGFIYDNNLIKDFCKEWEWLEHYSKKTRENGYGCSALDWYWNDGVRLSVDGDDWGGIDSGHAFGVRFCKPITGKARKGGKR